MKKPTVSIVLCVYNEEEDLPSCLDNMMKQSLKDFEIVVVDDGSNDKTVEIARKHKIGRKHKVKIVKQKHLGLGAARNNGVKNSKGKIVTFLDADMKFHKNYIKELIKPILDGKHFGTTHGQEYANNLKSPWARCWGKIRILKGYKNPKNYRAILRSKFLKTKGFDPTWGYADDQSLTAQVGYAMIADKAICYHKNPATLTDTFKQMRWVGGSYSLKKMIKLLAAPFIVYIALLIILWKNFMTAISLTLGLVFAFYLLYMIYSTIKAILREKDATLIYLYPIFNTVRILGVLTGIVRKSTRKGIMM